MLKPPNNPKIELKYHSVPEITLIPTEFSHIPHFFEFEKDPTAVHMAAFATLATDLSLFTATWQRRLQNTENLHRTIILNETVVGGIIAYEMHSQRHIGYWIDQAQWGKGIATEALKQFLLVEKTRPLTATCVADNTGSRRVLEKNGFVYDRSEIQPAPARNSDVEEAFFILQE